MAIIDGNGDGVSDVWTRFYRAEMLNPNDDTDGDQYTNLTESIVGSDPLDATSQPTITKIQYLSQAPYVQWSAKSGTTYDLEKANSPSGPWVLDSEQFAPFNGIMNHAFSPSKNIREFFRIKVNGSIKDAPKIDSDGDGQSDPAEILAHTDPYSPVSLFEIGSFSLTDMFQLEFQSMPGIRYQFQTYQTGTGWTNAGAPFSTMGGPANARFPAQPGTSMFRIALNAQDTDNDGVSDWEEILAGLDPHRAITQGTTPDSQRIQDLLSEPERYEIRSIRSTADPAAGREGKIEIHRISGLGRAKLPLFIGGDAEGGTDIVPLPTSVSFSIGQSMVQLSVTALVGATNGCAVTVRTLDPTLMDAQSPSGAEVRVRHTTTLSIADFGAIGDGITDDTLAIQATINAMEADPQFNTLYFPVGIYRLGISTASAETPTSTHRLLKLGSSDLSGRDLRLIGAPGAILYSTSSPLRSHMLVAMGSFRSLTFEGLCFKKSDTPLAAGEPNGADGVSLVQTGYNTIEEVSFDNCTFINCHGAVFVYGNGYDVRGHLRSLNFENCEVLNPWGSNTTDVQNRWGGGQQIAMGAWVGTANYHNCHFSGGGTDMSDHDHAPAGRMKDGCHFGSPMRLVFYDNTVEKMAIESVYQTNGANYMGTTAAGFAIPPADGVSTVTIPLRPEESTYLPGQILSFRIPTTGTTNGSNILLRVIAWDSVSNHLTVANDGSTGNFPAGTVLPSSLQIYLQEPTPAKIDIRRNRIIGTVPPGAEASRPFGISTDVTGIIAENTIVDCLIGVSIYREVTQPLFPGSQGLKIENNDIFLRTPGQATDATTYGINSFANDGRVTDNRIFCPLSRRAAGIAIRGKNTLVLNNHISADHQVVNGYNNSNRSVGILVGNTSYGTKVDGNTTRNFDVGVGPEPNQWIIHSVINHTSINDVLDIDFRGLVNP